MMTEKLKQGDKINLRITGTGVGGEGVGRAGDFVVFVQYAVPGDLVLARVTYVKKTFCTAVLLEIIEVSPDRVPTLCNRFGKCGGCAFLNTAYSRQLVEKRTQLQATLKKFAGYNGDVAEVVPSEPYAYRNKLQLPFGITDGKVSMGFYKEGTHKVVSIGKCFLHDDWAEKLITILKNWANGNDVSVYTDDNKSGLLRHAVARRLEKKLQLTLVINGNKIPAENALLKDLKAEFSDITLYLNCNKQETNVILGDTLIPIFAHRQTVTVLGIEAEINPFSFLQINDIVRNLLYRAVLDKILTNDGTSNNELASNLIQTENRNETAIKETQVSPTASNGLAKHTVVDAYAGVGILSAVLAKRGAWVYNIEIVPEATADANRLAEQNGVADRVINTNGDAAVLLPKLLARIAETAKKGDTVTVLLDPPRKGCDSRVLNAIITAAELVNLQLIYISCNPATLARDLQILQPAFQIDSVTPFDMFPQTPHVETMVCLTKKK